MAHLTWVDVHEIEYSSHGGDPEEVLGVSMSSKELSLC